MNLIFSLPNYFLMGLNLPADLLDLELALSVAALVQPSDLCFEISYGFFSFSYLVFLSFDHL